MYVCMHACMYVSERCINSAFYYEKHAHPAPSTASSPLPLLTCIDIQAHTYIQDTAQVHQQLSFV